MTYSDTSTCPAILPSGATRLNCYCGPVSQKSFAVYGTGVYTADSRICMAALHAGAIGEDGGNVVIEATGAQGSFTASVRNGVTSKAYGRWPASFKVSKGPPVSVQAPSAKAAPSATPAAPEARTAAAAPSAAPRPASSDLPLDKPGPQESYDDWQRRKVRVAVVALLKGDWIGAMYLRGEDAERAALHFEPAGPADGDAIVKGVATAADGGKVPFKVAYDRKGRIAFASVDSSGRLGDMRIGAAGFSTETKRDERNREVIELGRVDDTMGMFFRQQPDEGRFKALPFVERCMDFDRWVSVRMAARAQAERLKVAFYAGMARLDQDQMSLAEAFSDAVMQKHFGVRVSELSGTDFGAFLRAFRDCALTARTGYNPRAYADLIDRRSLENELGYLRRLRWVSVPSGGYGKTAVSAAALAKATSEAEAALPAIAAEAMAADGVDAIDAVLSAHASELALMTPSAIALAFQPLEKRLAGFTTADAAAATTDRLEKSRLRRAGLAFPPVAVPDDRRSFLESLVDGKQTALTWDATNYLLGVVLHAIQTCGKPGLAEKAALIGFMSRASGGLVTGQNYSDPDLFGKSKGNVADMAAEAAGEHDAKALGCSSPFLDLVLSSLVDLETAVSTADDGRPTLFVRTCSQRKTEFQCRCIASEARQIYPMINTTPYSSGLMAELTTRNPLAAGKVFSACGVQNY